MRLDKKGRTWRYYSNPPALLNKMDWSRKWKSGSDELISNTQTTQQPWSESYFTTTAETCTVDVIRFACEISLSGT